MKILIILFTILLVYGTTYAQDTKKLSGKWVGSYVCSQGETGLTLKIKCKSNGDITGTFTFYSIPSNTDPLVKSGKFSFTGKYTSSGKIMLNQNKWIKQPENYGMVDMEGELKEPNIFSGKISNLNCGNFKVVKK